MSEKLLRCPACDAEVLRCPACGGELELEITAGPLVDTKYGLAHDDIDAWYEVRCRQCGRTLAEAANVSGSTDAVKAAEALEQRLESMAFAIDIVLGVVGLDDRRYANAVAALGHLLVAHSLCAGETPEETRENLDFVREQARALQASVEAMLHEVEAHAGDE